VDRTIRIWLGVAHCSVPADRPRVAV